MDDAHTFRDAEDAGIRRGMSMSVEYDTFETPPMAWRRRVSIFTGRLRQCASSRRRGHELAPLVDEMTPPSSARRQFLDGPAAVLSHRADESSPRSRGRYFICRRRAYDDDTSSRLAIGPISLQYRCRTISIARLLGPGI